MLSPIEFPNAKPPKPGAVLILCIVVESNNACTGTFMADQIVFIIR